MSDRGKLHWINGNNRVSCGKRKTRGLRATADKAEALAAEDIGDACEACRATWAWAVSVWDCIESR